MAYINQTMSVKASSEGIQKVRQCMAELIRPNNRDEKGWTIPDLAERSGAGESTVKRFLNGRPVRFDSLVWITEAVGLKPEDVIDAPLNETEASIVNWIAICGGMLAKQKEARQLRKEATAIGAEVNVYVPLDLLEHKEQTRSKQDKADSDQRNQYQERKVVKTYEHDNFLRSLTDRQSKNKHIAIVGEAGAGKTTLLARIADELNKKQKLQIFVSLADLQGRSLDDHIYGKWLSEALGIQKDSINPEQKNDLFQQFQSGAIWLLLDGLDEMRAKSSADALEKIKYEIKEVIGQSRVVLTSRLNVWDASLNGLSGFDTFRMGDFSPEQVDQFISDWFVEAGKPESAPILQAKLKEPNRDRIRDMVRHPLRLALLCQAFYRDLNTELPETKAGLYELFVRYFYEWKPNIVDEDLTQDALREELHLALGKLAIAGIDGDAGFRLSRSLAVKEMGDRLFKLASDVGWLTLIERDEQDQEVYAFYHASFQEYFAALAIDDWNFFVPREHIDRLVKGKYRIFEPEWEETIRLWVGRECISEAKKTAFFKAITSFKDGCGDFYYYRAYYLAALLTPQIINVNSLSILIDKIVNQIIVWQFGWYDQKNLEWRTYSKIIPFKDDLFLEKTYSQRLINILFSNLNTLRYQILEYYNLHFSKIHTDIFDDIYRQVNSIPNKIFKITRYISNFTKNSSLFLETAIENCINKEYPYDRLIFEELIGIIENKKNVKKLLGILLAQKQEYENSKDENCLNTIGFLILCLGKTNVCKNEVIYELTIILKDIKYKTLHWSVAENICNIDNNNELAIFKLIEPLKQNEWIDGISEILKKFAVGNKQAIDLLVEIVLNNHIQTNASFLAVECLSNISEGDERVVNILFDKLQIAIDIEKDLLKLDDINEYLRQIEDVEASVSNICNCLSNIVNKRNSEEVIDKLISILNLFDDDEIRLDITQSIERISPNNPRIANDISNIIGNIKYQAPFMEYTIQIFRSNQKLVKQLEEILYANFLKSKNYDEKASFAKLLSSISNDSKLIEAFSQIILNSKNEKEKNVFAEILAKIDLDNSIAINQLIIAIQRDTEEDSFVNSKFLLHGIKSKKTMRKVVLSLSKFINNYSHNNNFDNDKQVIPTNTINCYKVLHHCAENMSYPDFYEAWHSQPTSTHPEIADTIPSNNTNKIQTLESQLIDCEAIQKGLDRNTDHPEIRCLVVDIRQLEQESDPNVIAKKLTNKIFNSIGRRIPVVQDVSCLERELLNLKLEPEFKKLAIALYGKSANEAINQLCQNPSTNSNTPIHRRTNQ
ncbi:NACHT domain-containing protein [Pseudanabaena minima]|uniref:NACHT domain-containing protein n=1 Tax=Pseudanabaena minima TaxID=890415 RepID=UPI003DA9C53C